MSVSVSNWVVKEYYGGTRNSLTVEVYSSSGLVASRTLTMNGTSGSASFSGLNSNTNYYVRFSVPNNGNKYSFNGKIS
jgi:hypothetical protein